MPKPETATERLGAFEALAAEVRAELAADEARMAELRSQGKVKTATYRQLFASRSMLRDICRRLDEHGL